MTDTQQQDTQQCCGRRHRSALPFLVIGIAAILVGGLVAAAVAHAPSQDMVWLVAYLVLVVGLAQVAFGCGQAVLAAKRVALIMVSAELLLFNVGNAGVIAGTLAGTFTPVLVGTILLLLALGLFYYRTRGDDERERLRYGYQALLVLIGIGALVGVTLSALANFG